MKALTNEQYYLGYKIVYASFWDESWVVFFPKDSEKKFYVPHKFSSLAEAQKFIRENDEEPENGLMRYLAE